MQPLIRATTHTAALRHNLARVRQLAPRSRVMVVTKANAYGHGAVRAAQALADADALAVARLGEALALRAAGIEHRILVLEGVYCADEFAVAAGHRLDVVVQNFEQVALLERARDGAHHVWIKIDTGMHRLGFHPDDFRAAYERIRRARGVEHPPALMTHLACADEPEDPMTGRQLETFRRVTDGVPGERSIANSAGILAWPDAISDWVRPGLMLYGLSPMADGVGAELGLQPAMTLESHVIAVKTVRAGETVGYGGDWRAERESRIAVVACGYADGYPREMPSGAPVIVGGTRAPLAGRVSMDMLTVDVTDLPRIAVGDPVVLWGAGNPVEGLARLAGTIPYTLVCGVTERVTRVFA